MQSRVQQQQPDPFVEMALKMMTKIVVRLPEPRKEYTEDNQRQINRTITSLIEQLNSTFLTQEKEQQERFNFFMS